jgi:hypothetical protein
MCLHLAAIVDSTEKVFRYPLNIIGLNDIRLFIKLILWDY